MFEPQKKKARRSLAPAAISPSLYVCRQVGISQEPGSRKEKNKKGKKKINRLV